MPSSNSAGVTPKAVPFAGAAGERVLLRGATILSMDRSVGDLETGDILVEGSKIVAVERSIDAACPAIDLCGRIVVPGFHDTHLHCWQGVWRRLIPNGTIADYLTYSHYGFAEVYAPEDMYAGTLLSALTSINHGVTTLLDYSSNPRTSVHVEEAIRGLADAGIRAAFAHGPVINSKAAANMPWPEDLPSLQKRHFASTDQLLTLRHGEYGLRYMENPQDTTMRMAKARELGLPISIDGVVGPKASECILAWRRAGALGPDLELIHCTDLTDEAWKAIAESGTCVSLAPTSDAHYRIGSGIAPIQACIDHGIRPGLSVDTPVALASDFISQMRFVLHLQRMNSRRAPTPEESVELVSVQDVLEFATVAGARVNGLERVCGSLTPGKQADLLIIEADNINTLPNNNAYGTVVLGADSADISGVMIAGRFRKWNSKLVDVDLAKLKEVVLASRERLFRAKGYDIDVFSERPPNF